MAVTSESRMLEFENKIFNNSLSTPIVKKSYRSKVKFDPDLYIKFIDSEKYRTINEEIQIIDSRRKELIMELHKAFPTGEKHTWHEESGSFVVKLRDEYMED